MILVDHEIEGLAKSQGLIGHYAPKQVMNCRYNLRAGRAFAADTGAEIILEGGSRTTTVPFWSIKPSETLMIMTLETVKIPDNLLASYGPLFGLAKKGLLLVNASIIEPGYDGPLSCYLVNFSQETVKISAGDDIAKMCFFQLTGAPHDYKPSHLDEKDYAKELGKAAASYPSSFLGIGDLEKRISDSVTKSVTRSVAFGGIMIAVLVAWATFEPLTSKWFFEKIGVSTNTTTSDVMKLRQDLQTDAVELKHAQEDLKRAEDQTAIKTRTDQLEKQLSDIQAATKRLNDSLKNRPH